MPKNQKTLIAIIASVILIAIAIGFIIFNNQNRGTNTISTNSSSSSNSAVSVSSLTSTPPTPGENGASDPMAVTPPTGIPTPGMPSDLTNSLGNSNPRQSIPTTASAPISTGITTSLPVNPSNSTGIIMSIPTNTNPASINTNQPDIAPAPTR